MSSRKVERVVVKSYQQLWSVWRNAPYGEYPRAGTARSSTLSPVTGEGTMPKMRIVAALASLLPLAAMTQTQAADEWPTRPVVMVVPFAAGGPTDVVGRIVAQRLGEILKQQVVVENVGGAGGMTGAQRIANAQPDGYQVLLGTVGTHAYNQTLYKHPLYNSTTDFTPVALIAEQPLVLLTRKDFPAENLKDFIAYA